MDQFNTPWRVTAAAIYTTPTDSRVYGTLDIDVTDAKRFLDEKRGSGVKITMTHLATAVLARAVAFDVPEMNCFIRRGRVVGRQRLDVMVPVAIGGGEGVSAILVKDAHARTVTSIAEEIRTRRRGQSCGYGIQNGTRTSTVESRSLAVAAPGVPLSQVDHGRHGRSRSRRWDCQPTASARFVVSDIGSFGLNTGMTSLMPAAKVPAVIVLGKIEEKAVVRNGEIEIRTILPLTGTFDHRIVDGLQIGKARARHQTQLQKA